MEGDNAHDFEPIAIIGAGCRLPGGVSSPSSFWSLLQNNQCGHGRVPKSRYNSEAFYHDDPERPGSIHSKNGYFLDRDVNDCDTSFFNINNIEAKTMDAQQKQLLEVVYECFEDSGAPLECIRGHNIGVFVGNFTNDHLIMQYKDPEYFSRYSAVGTGPTLLSNRITHAFDLHGPSVTLDTACSSSIYALHFACQALNNRDCDGAVVASANLIQSAEQQLIAVKAGILSDDGFCHSFDSAARGYGRAEGVVATYIKRLSDAVRDGDTVRAIIRGTAINGNGNTMGISAPSVAGQEAVIRSAYEKAGVSLDNTSYVEAHGTGTKVGDPVEVEAISRAFGTSRKQPICVGSLKPSLGHSEGASGLSSLLKVLLSLENCTIPATIGIKEISPAIRCKEWNIHIVAKNQVWPCSSTLQASINSFGFGGANGHAILEAAKDIGVRDQSASDKSTSYSSSRASIKEKTSDANSNSRFPDHEISTEKAKAPPEDETMKNDVAFFLLSARTARSLEGNIQRLSTWLKNQNSPIDFTALEFTLNCRRSRFDHRAYIIQSATSFCNGIKQSDISTEVVGKIAKAPLTFVFTGQGAQWNGMGRGLMKYYEIFRRSILRSSSILQYFAEHSDSKWKLEELILLDEITFSAHAPDIAQPSCTAIQIALVDLLRDWGICPDVVLGHSSGEIAAAYAAGFITLEQALAVAFARGKVISNHAKHGAMVALGLGENDSRKLIDEAGLSSLVSVSCINSPHNTTISGDISAIEALAASVQQNGRFAKVLNTGGAAYHSHHMRQLGERYEDLVTSLWGQIQTDCGQNLSVTKPHMISTLTGLAATIEVIGTTQYWRKNLESPVKFDPAMRSAMTASGSKIIIEIGPHSALEVPIREIAADCSFSPGDFLYLSSLKRGKGAVHSLLGLCGSLFQSGRDDIQFARLSPNMRDTGSNRYRLLHDLPGYAWDYSESTKPTDSRIVHEFRHRIYPRHSLLGSRIPGASRPTIAWRNILHVSEVPWLKDHCLGPSIVFPAAAYIAMAIEAVCQVNDIAFRDCPGIDIRKLNFLKTMDLDTEAKPQIEILTELRRSKISSSLSSDSWWDLSICTMHGETNEETVHMTAAVALLPPLNILKQEIQTDINAMEMQRSDVWYNKFTDQGLRWGPDFAVMDAVYVDRCRKQYHAAASTCLRRGRKVLHKNQYEYIIHPVTIDGMLQTAFVATTAGWIRELRATVPVSMERVQISSFAAHVTADTACLYGARSRKTGFGILNIDAELVHESGHVLMNMDQVRCVPYQGKAQNNLTGVRKPLARVVWKPDITKLLGSKDVAFPQRLRPISRPSSQLFPPAYLPVVSYLDLATHKNPRANIIYNGKSSKFILLCEDVLQLKSPLKRCSSFVSITLDESNCPIFVTHGESSRDELPSNLKRVDIIICDHGYEFSAHCKPWISTNTMLLSLSDEAPSSIPVGWETTSFRADWSLRVCQMINTNPRPQASKSKRFKSIAIVNRDGEETPLDKFLRETLEVEFETSVTAFGLGANNIDLCRDGTFFIFTIETQTAILSTLSQDDLVAIQRITDSASKIIWLSSQAILQGGNPDQALISGLSRAIMLEQPSVMFSTFAIDDISINLNSTAQNLVAIIEEMLSTPCPDVEYVQNQGILHVARWDPEERLNELFNARQEQRTAKTALSAAQECQLSIRYPGSFQSLHFVACNIGTDTPTDHVVVQVKTIGLNAKDLYALAGKIDTRNMTCSCECAGVIVAIGANVHDLAVGDRVVCMAPGHFGTFEYVPEWAVVKIHDEEAFEEICTIPIVYSTALYALKYRASLQAGESVLIHSAAGGLGIAAINVARSIGAEIFCTVGTESKRNFLIENFNIEADHIYLSQDSSFVAPILEATCGEGVDVVLNSLTGELLHGTLEVCANFGRFIEVGKKDIIDHGNLDMSNFKRNISFMAFDLAEIFYSKKTSHHKLWAQLLAQSLSFVRGTVDANPTPIKTFDVSEVSQAFRYLALRTRVGKVVVSLQNPESLVELIPPRYLSRFSASKTYLMVGCLGGLGRSIVKWMVNLGARSFVFLGRSGSTKVAARTLVDDLIAFGVDVKVIRGDVANYSDVIEATSAAKFPIGGVVQASMCLNEALWTTMTHDAWHTSIQPKVQGTWNLHNALLKDGRKRHLDFFLLTSSISGTVGTATESNYCSANAFLDAFARYRRSHRLPAVSVGLGMISEVGYLHEHPEIEKLLRRKGIHSITEEELLQIIDLALITQQTDEVKTSYDELSASHLLTGIEFIGLKKQRDVGFEGDNHVLSDPRASRFAAAFERMNSSADHPDNFAPYKLPREIIDPLNDRSGMTLAEAITAVVKRKIANLILVSEDKLQLQKRLGEFGLDSMLAAEFRTFIYRTLEVDVPFITLLDRSTSINDLVLVITEQIKARMLRKAGTIA